MRKYLQRGIIGFSVGINLGLFISLVCSYLFSNDKYVMCVPEFTKSIGSEHLAAIIQIALSGIVGTCFAICSSFFEGEDASSSLVKSTVYHFVCTMLPLYIAAYTLYWMPHKILGVSGFIIQSLIVYVIVWFVYYIIVKNQINKINASLKKNR